MGWLGRVLSFARLKRNAAQVSDVQIDTGGGNVITARHFAAAGDDAFPLDTDFAFGAGVQQTGREGVAGYLDPINPPKSGQGEKRIYGRDAGSGECVVEVWLKNDSTATVFNAAGSFTLTPSGEMTSRNDSGSFTLSPSGEITGRNGGGSFVLQSGGDFVINGVTISSSGAVTIPASLIVSGKQLAGHNHPAGSPPGNTGSNN